MRASEFINEGLATGIAKGLGGLAVGAGRALAKATKKLGTTTTSMINNAAPKVMSTLGGAKSTGTQTMAQVLGKGSGSYVAKKTAEPPQQNTGTVTQQSQQPQLVKTGDMIEIPNLGQTKVVKTGGTTVTFQDPTDPDTTITTDKKKLGLK